MDKKDIVTFKNISDKPFRWSWNSEPTDFKPGEEKPMELWKALFFAKHLVDHLLNEKNIGVDIKAERDKLVEKIIKDVDVKDEAEEVAAPTLEAPKKEKEEEFADLKKKGKNK